MIKNRLFELLLLYNIKPTDIANITQFDRTTITRVLKGEAQLIPFELINKLKDTLNVSLDFIFNDVPNNAIKLKCNKLETDIYINYYQYLLLKFHNLIYDELEDNKVINHILPDNLSYIFDTRSKINKNIQKEIENSNLLDYMSFMLIPTTNLTYYKNKVLNIYKALFIDSLFYVYGDNFFNEYLLGKEKINKLYNFETLTYDIVFEDYKIVKRVYQTLADKKGNCTLSKMLKVNKNDFVHIIDYWGILGYEKIELDKEYPHIKLIGYGYKPKHLFHEISRFVGYSIIGVCFKTGDDPKCYCYELELYKHGKGIDLLPADNSTIDNLMEAFYERLEDEHMFDELNEELVDEQLQIIENGGSLEDFNKKYEKWYDPEAQKDGEEVEEYLKEKMENYDAFKLWNNESKSTLFKDENGTEYVMLTFKKEDIISKDDKSMLFKLSSMIKDNKYEGYKFYHRLNMCKEVGQNVLISFPTSWNFVVFKEDDNQKIIDKQCINASDFCKIILGKGFLKKD